MWQNHKMIQERGLLLKAHNVTPVSQQTEQSVRNLRSICIFLYWQTVWYQVHPQTVQSTAAYSSFSINALPFFYICVEAMTFRHKGNKEIKLIWVGNEVTEGCLSSWYVCTVNWKAEFNVNKQMNELGSCFPFHFRQTKCNLWKGKLNIRLNSIQATLYLSGISVHLRNVRDMSQNSMLELYLIPL